MPKEDHVEFAGTVVDALGGGQYSVKITDTGAEVRARLCGKMKKFSIRVLPGDRVKVAFSPYDTSHGMITFRERT